MIYGIRRFSYPQELMVRGGEHISDGVDTGLEWIEDTSTKITEDPRLKELRPVKRHVKFVRDLSTLLRRKKKKKKKEFSEDPTTTLNTSEANKFKVALNRLSSSMGGSDSQSLVK